MHYYKKNIGDYAKKTGRLSMLQHGAYTLLIDSCYDRERFPTLEDAIEWTWASSTEELEAVKFVLTRFFTLQDGVYVQGRIQEEIAEYHSKAETNKRIAVEREAKRKEKSTTRARDVNDSTKAGDEPPPNQEPRTTNQEPNSPKGEKAPAALSVSELVADGLTTETAAEWVSHRRKVKAPLTPKAWGQIKSEAEKAGWTIENAVLHSLANGWKGFNHDWVRSRGGQAQRPSSHAGFAQVNYREGINDDGSFN